MKKVFVTLMVSITFIACGCNWGSQTQQTGYKTVAADPSRNTDIARKYNAQAVILITENRLDQAEKLLKDALACDVFFGPAHNNLGHVYHKQKKYYLAAWEFQYAAKLMPNYAEPKNNLAMVLEAVGKTDQAADNYEMALKLQPDNPQIIGNLAKLYVKQNRNDERTHQLLEEIVMKDSRQDWIKWAQNQLILKRYKDK